MHIKEDKIQSIIESCEASSERYAGHEAGYEFLSVAQQLKNLIPNEKPKAVDEISKYDFVDDWLTNTITRDFKGVRLRSVEWAEKILGSHNPRNHIRIISALKHLENLGKVRKERYDGELSSVGPLWNVLDD